MQNNRASIFAPFKALNGLYEAYEMVELMHNNNYSTNIDYILNEIIKKLKPLSKIEVEYYYNLDYIKLIDVFIKYDSKNKKIYLKNSIISLDDIINIKLI